MMSQPASLALQRGGDVDATAWAALCGADVPNDAGRAPLLVVRSVNAPVLRTALAPPYGGVLEWPADFPATILMAEVAGAGRGLLSLRLSTASAIGLDLAQHVADALALRVGLAETVREAVQLAVHEAISNAIVHGNLGLPGMPRRRVEDLELFAARLREQLAQPALAARRLAVDVQCALHTITVAVHDQGQGYAGSPVLAQQTYGRGLQIIRALAQAVRFADCGRRIELDFAR